MSRPPRLAMFSLHRYSHVHVLQTISRSIYISVHTPLLRSHLPTPMQPPEPVTMTARMLPPMTSYIPNITTMPIPLTLSISAFALADLALVNTALD